MRIEDYALIGDTETAALVGRNGSIDRCACRASTHRHASLLCSVTGATAAGCSHRPVAIESSGSTCRERRLSSLANDVGLLAEEYDPHTGRMLGNFPEAFSHVGLVNTALNPGTGPRPAEERKER